MLGRTNSKALALNDDRLEKKKRRQTILVDRRKSLLPSLKDLSGHDKGSSDSPSKPVNALDANLINAPLPEWHLSKEEAAKNYEQWMKIAADNVGSSVTIFECSHRGW